MFAAGKIYEGPCAQLAALVIHEWPTSTNIWSTKTLLWHCHVYCFVDAKISRHIDFLGVYIFDFPPTRNSGGSCLACSPTNSHTHQQRLQNARRCCCSLTLPGGHQVDGLPPAPSKRIGSEPCRAQALFVRSQPECPRTQIRYQGNFLPRRRVQ